MWRSEYHVRVVFHELGDALSGRDVLMPDGKYHKCQTYFRDGERSKEAIEREIREGTFQDILDVQFFGPYSNTSGD